MDKVWKELYNELSVKKNKMGTLAGKWINHDIIPLLNNITHFLSNV